MLGYTFVDSNMNPYITLGNAKEDMFYNLGQCRVLVQKLNTFYIQRNIVFLTCFVSRYLIPPRTSCRDALKVLQFGVSCTKIKDACL